MRIRIFLILFFTMTIAVSAQNENDMIRVVGDTLMGKLVNGENQREVIGNVIMTQGNVTITCDHAIQYLAANEAKLMGNVVVKQDTITVQTPHGYYYGNTRKAYSDTSIIVNDGHVTLTANRGYYYFEEHKADLFSNVKLRDNINTLNALRLIYYQDSSKAVSFGNVSIHDTASVIYADSLIYYRNTKDTYAFNNIRIYNIHNSVFIAGQKLVDISDSSYTRITGKPILTQIDTADDGVIDTLVITSNEMISKKDSLETLTALDSVKIVRGDFASVNNRTIYYRNEGKIFLYKKEDEPAQPIIWYDNSQLTGDSVYIFQKDRRIDLITIDKNAFLLSTIKGYNYRYDQISGDTINMHFDKGKLNRILVNGNVLSIYYIFDENKPNGLIKSSSENAKIIVDSGRVADVRLYISAVTEYHPEKLLIGKEQEFTLPSFVIYYNRPKKEDLMNDRQINNTELIMNKLPE